MNRGKHNALPPPQAGEGTKTESLAMIGKLI
jgi:hypothetical protein